MKLLAPTFLLLISLLAFQSCGLMGSPDATATDFMNHLVQGNYDAAKKLSTTNTERLISLIQDLQNLADKEQKEEKKKTVFDCSCEQEGDKATCDCCEKEDANECTSLSVFKVEGEWLVDMKKEDIGN